MQYGTCMVWWWGFGRFVFVILCAMQVIGFGLVLRFVRLGGSIPTPQPHPPHTTTHPPPNPLEEQQILPLVHGGQRPLPPSSGASGVVRVIGVERRRALALAGGGPHLVALLFWFGWLVGLNGGVFVVCGYYYCYFDFGGAGGRCVEVGVGGGGWGDAMRLCAGRWEGTYRSPPVLVDLVGWWVGVVGGCVHTYMFFIVFLKLLYIYTPIHYQYTNTTAQSCHRTRTTARPPRPGAAPAHVTVD